jgi:hypothetical protein
MTSCTRLSASWRTPLGSRLMGDTLDTLRQLVDAMKQQPASHEMAYPNAQSFALPASVMLKGLELSAPNPAALTALTSPSIYNASPDFGDGYDVPPDFGSNDFDPNNPVNWFPSSLRPRTSRVPCPRSKTSRTLLPRSRTSSRLPSPSRRPRVRYTV